MVPDRFVPSVELPRRPNGKIDRDRPWPLVGPTAAGRGRARGAAATSVERAVAEMWREHPRPPRVSMTDNFFDVGGHSLLATRLVSLVRGRFGVDLPLQAVFEHPTAGELAAVHRRPCRRARRHRA